ncbi:MAG: hypothetical protein R3F29_04575 [Planctomycetota bacterium]
MTRLHLISPLFTLAAALPAQLNWIANPATGNEYALIPPMSWTAAQTYAEGVGAQLCVIDDATENAWVADHFLSVFAIYIGGTDAGIEGVWTTPYGWPLGYTNWSNGTVTQPDNAGGSENYLVMWDANPLFGVARGSWNDSDGLGALFAVAERPLPLFVPYGAGCGGSNGAPALAESATSQAPAPGATIAADLTGLPGPSGAAIGFLSLGRIQAPLDVLGMPGCEALVDIGGAWTAVLAYAGTDITWQETLPNLLVIRGLHFHMQALVLDAAANGFGATTSNALEVHVGF